MKEGENSLSKNNINRKGNETSPNYRNVNSLLNQSPQQRSEQNIAQNREEGNENYKLKDKNLSAAIYAQEQALSEESYAQDRKE